MEYIILAAVTVSIVLGIISIIRSKKSDRTDELKVKIDELEKQNNELKNELISSNGALNAKIEMLMSSVSQSVSSLSGDIKKIDESVTSKLGDILKQNSEQSDKILTNLQDNLMRLMRSNDEKLEQMRQTVDEKLSATLSARLDSSFKTVGDQLVKLYNSLGEMKSLNEGVTANVTNLNRILTNVKTRGTWAEYRLETILDQTIPNMYIKNFKPSVPNSGFVEFAVKIPSDGDRISYLPIDSKFPMEDYARLCDALEIADAEAAENSRKALEARVMTEAKTVKKYINPPETTPFAILYLATEGLYAEIASSKNCLLEKLQDENILLAGPTTITALLNSLSMGFRTIAINEKADEIKNVLAAIKKQYGEFSTLLAKVKKKIGEADTELDRGIKRNDIIQKKLRDMDDIELETANDILEIDE